MAIIAVALLSLQCGKGKPPTTPGTVLLYGLDVELKPVDLPPPPAGTVYEAWFFRLEASGPGYKARFIPFKRFGWNDYKFKFTDPNTGTDLGDVFRASPDTTNLFIQNLTTFVRADTIGKIVEKLVRGQTVPLPGLSRNLAQMIGFLLSIEPAGSVGPDTFPSSALMVAYSNDSGKVDMVYPYNYRNRDFFVQYFMATPTDTLYFLKCACNVTDSNQIRDEGRGVWFGFIDTTRYDLGRRMAKPDTVLRKLCRELMPGWQFQGWIEKNGTLLSMGHFNRADTTDDANIYAFNPDSCFFVPGEDYTTDTLRIPPAFRKNVLGSIIRITLEPKPDTDPNMYPLIVFQDTIRKTFSSVDDPEIGPVSNLHRNFVSKNRSRFLPKMHVRVIPRQRS